MGNDLVSVDLAAFDHFSGRQIVLQLVGGAAVDVDLIIVDGVDLDGGLARSGKAGEQVHRTAALAQLQGGVHQSRHADGHNDDVHALAVGLAVNDGGQILLGGIHHQVCAQLQGHLAALLVGLADDDLAGSGDLGQLQVEQADRACTHDENIIIEAGAGVLQAADTAGQGLDQSAGLIGHVLGQLDHISVLDADGGDADILLEAAVELIADGLAVQAGVGAAPQAAAAMVTGDDVGHGDLLTHLIALHVGTHFGDNAAEFVADDRGIADSLCLLSSENPHIRAADGGSLHFQQDLIRADLGLFNLRRSELIGTRQDNCSHENFLLPFTCYMI